VSPSSILAPVVTVTRCTQHDVYFRANPRRLFLKMNEVG